MTIKILFLIPPSSKKIIRDQYCSMTPKAQCYWPPVDFLALSANFPPTVIIEFLDCNIKSGNSLAAIENFAPQAIITLSSILTFNSDLQFINELKKSLNFQSLLIGDIFYSHPELFIYDDAIDCIAYNYPNSDIWDYIQGQTPQTNLCYKTSEGVFYGSKSSPQLPAYRTRHELFFSNEYKFPFIPQGNRWANIISSFGCKHQCSYCNTPPMEVLIKDPMVLKNELNFLNSHQINYLWIRDLNFTNTIENIQNFCNILIQDHLAIKWFCEARLEVLTPKLIQLMKKAGCFLVMTGVDTLDHESSQLTSRSLNYSLFQANLKTLKQLGILTHGYLILGIPSDTRLRLWKRIFLLFKLDLQFLSINIFVPRPGSKSAEKYIHQYLFQQTTAFDSSIWNAPLNL